MWLVAEYEATTLFTLKPATATVSGGRTLLVPTPFAVKMALLDVICRLEGVDFAAQVWDDWLGTVTVALRPANSVVVNNTFIKILKPRRRPASPGTQNAGHFQQTISYREYAHFAGTLGIALDIPDDVDNTQIAYWLLNINYLGKRGSFMQLQDTPHHTDVLPTGFVVIGGGMQTIPIDALLTQLDDVGNGVTFAHVDIYSGKRLRLGQHRILHHVALPYDLMASSRGYSYYRINEDR